MINYVMGLSVMKNEDKNYKGALQVALRYLMHKDRTENEISERLAKEEYSEEIISDVIVYLRQQGYLNDKRYAEYYFVCYKEKRSIKRIEIELLRKGIDQNIIDNIKDSLNITQSEAVCRALKKQLIKRKIDSFESATYEEKNMIRAALYRQGYSVESISYVLNNDIC